MITNLFLFVAATGIMALVIWGSIESDEMEGRDYE